MGRSRRLARLVADEKVGSRSHRGKNPFNTRNKAGFRVCIDLKNPVRRQNEVIRYRPDLQALLRTASGGAPLCCFAETEDPVMLYIFSIKY